VWGVDGAGREGPASIAGDRRTLLGRAAFRGASTLLRAGRFREDLYYRLNVFRLEVPPLRARRSDIPLLVEYLLRERSRGTSQVSVSPLAMRLLQSHSWPGNVRELFSVLESALIRAHGGNRIEAQHLPPEIREGEGQLESEGGLERYVSRESPSREQDTILAALEEAGGVRSRAARILGMGRTTLWRKMREYGIGMDES